MFFNTNIERIDTTEGTEINQALTETGEQDFKYLGSWCNQDRDITTRKALAWQSLNKLTKIWKSNLDQNPGIQSINRNNLTLWKPYLNLDKKRGKNARHFTKMLRVVHNVSWRDNIPNKTLYEDLQLIFNVIKKRKLKVSGHTFGGKSSPAHSLITWDPQHGVSTRGHPNTTFVDTLLRDTGMENATQLEKLMANRA